MKRIVEPATQPVSLTEAKAHLRVDFSDDDILIASLLSTAISYVEEYTKSALIEQTWEEMLDHWPTMRGGDRDLLPGSHVDHASRWEVGRYIDLPRPPLIEVLSLEYQLVADADYEMFTDYQVETHVPRIVLDYAKHWPVGILMPANAIRIRWTCGYGTTSEEVPQNIRMAILLLVANWYENREPVVVGTTAMELPFAVEALLAPYRWVTM